jgi:hypothetical protein
MPHNPHPEERTPATVQTAIAAIGTKKRPAFPKLLSTSASRKRVPAFQVATTEIYYDECLGGKGHQKGLKLRCYRLPKQEIRSI